MILLPQVSLAFSLTSMIDVTLQHYFTRDSNPSTIDLNSHKNFETLLVTSCSRPSAELHFRIATNSNAQVVIDECYCSNGT